MRLPAVQHRGAVFLGAVALYLAVMALVVQRFAQRKLPWTQLQEVMRLLSTIFQPEKMAKTAVNW